MTLGISSSEDDDANESSSFMTDTDPNRAAASYSWEFFKLHAQQRQAVFRFYVLVVAAIVTGLATHAPDDKSAISKSAFGWFLIIASFLFWRLDARNLTLIRISEDYLIEDEKRLSNLISSEKIKLLSKAKTSVSKFRIIQLFQTFRNIYRTIFFLVALAGLLIIIGDSDFNGLMQKALKMLSLRSC